MNNPFVTPLKPRWLGASLERALGLHTLARYYEEKPVFNDDTSQVQAFLGYALERMGVNLVLHEDCSLNQVPSEGPLIIVCNHPLGGIEGMAMTQQLLTVRPDLQVLTNKLLTLIPELADTFIGVNVLAKDAAKENAKGIKASCAHLKQGGALLVYPAGVVSAFNPSTGLIEDQQWNRLVGMLMRKFDVPVLPCFVNAENSKLFNYAGLIHPRLRTVMLPRQMLNKTGKAFDWHIGQLISPDEVRHLESDYAITNYLRLSSNALQPVSDCVSDLRPDQSLQPLAVPPSQTKQQALQEQLMKLAQYALISHGSLTAYCVPYDDLGLMLDELAWAREKTFREVGEGSGNATDSDRFDPYYLHLFVWDSDRSAMVGGYRLGRVDEIVAQHGLEGLYSRSLYEFDLAYVRSLGACLEVGRSFVSPEYQRHPRALDMLWQGIGRYVAANPQYHTLFGCVSISQEYSNLARAFLSESMMVNFKAEQAYLNDIRPIKPLVVKGKVWSKTLLSSLTDIAVINKLVGRFDAGKSVPVLLRHYLALNGRFICFGLNEQFQSSLDGLIMVDLRETPMKYLKRYMGKDGASEFLAQWEAGNAVA